jgi:hypothetical protein
MKKMVLSNLHVSGPTVKIIPEFLFAFIFHFQTFLFFEKINGHKKA